MAASGRIVGVAVAELRAAVRSRRFLVVSLLFLAVAIAVMYWTISGFAAMEHEVLVGLGLPVSDNPGSVTMALWKSKPFLRVMERLTQNSLVFSDIVGRHPIVLAYAFFIFQIVPLLTLLVSSSRIAADLRSGTARYWFVRVTRDEWVLGMFFGEASLLAVSLLVAALAAWLTAIWRLQGVGCLGLLGGILDWSLRAWMYAFAWLGLFLGISQLARSGGKATALCILALMGAAAWTPMLKNLGAPQLLHLDVFVPGSALSLMWRRSPGVLLQGAVQLAALAFLYLALGAAVLRRRDV